MQPFMVNLLINKGVKVLDPPTTVPLLEEEKKHYAETGMPGYKKRPFIMLAAVYGNLEIFKMLLDAGCDVSEAGFLTFIP